MKVLSLFDGISCGMVALERAGIPVEEYHAYEIEPNAIKISKKNYPEIIHHGDVTIADFIQYKGFDLLIGGSPCFTAGTKILTDNGYKPIERIEVGDKVLTHQNRFKRVLQVGHNNNQEIYELKAQGILSTLVTGNHPYYVRTMTRVYDATKHQYVRTFSEPKWKAVSELTKNDFIGINIPKTEINPYNLDEETCWLLGRYLADGHIRHSKRLHRKNSYQYGVVYSIGNKKVEDFRSHLHNYHASIYPHTQSVYRVVISSQKLVEFIEKYNFGKGAINKRIPQLVLDLPTPLAKAVLEGYISGDGCRHSDKKVFSAVSISQELIMGLQLLVAKVYRTAANVVFYPRPKTAVIEDRIINQHDTYSLNYWIEIKKQNKSFVDREHNKLWYPIKNIIKVDMKTTVYNLEVEDDNSYTANNAIVHNCQSLSITQSKTRQNLDGKSKLFFEFVRAFEQVKPKYFLFENVASMKGECKQIISEYLGCEPIAIDSKDFSAQQRPRYYWTNIPVAPWSKSEVMLKDILDPSPDEKYFYDCEFDFHGLDKQVCATLHINGHDILKRVNSPYFKCHTLTTVGGGNTQKKVMDGNRPRKLTPLEYERLQTLPDNYTTGVSDTARYTACGNGWTVDVIAHILKGLREDI